MTTISHIMIGATITAVFSIYTILNILIPYLIYHYHYINIDSITKVIFILLYLFIINSSTYYYNTLFYIYLYFINDKIRTPKMPYLPLL